MLKQRCPNCELLLKIIYNKCTKCGWEGFMPFEYPEEIKRKMHKQAMRDRM